MRLPALFAAVFLSLCAFLPAAGRADPVMKDWFIFLESGRQTPDDKAAVAAMQRGHIANFEKLFAEGKLFAAGPLRDPARTKRGIVVVRAATMDELVQMFQADDYVREGYMTLNANTAIVHKALNTTGIDVARIEEARIIQLSRPAAPQDAAALERSRAFLRGLVEGGKAGAWYSPETGPVADILFVNSTDNAQIEQAFASHPDLVAGTARLAIWSQWLARGVVR